MASGDPLHTREAGLRKLLLAKRWIVALSVTLTGVLAAVAANAFPGKTIKTGAPAGGSERGAVGASSSGEPSGEGAPGSLEPPEQAPQSGEEQATEQQPESPSSEQGESQQAPETPVISGGS
jgi:hypothetical protein